MPMQKSSVREVKVNNQAIIIEPITDNTSLNPFVVKVKPEWPEWKIEGEAHSVVTTKDEVLILGYPPDEPDGLSEDQYADWYETAHNCDSMGCGWDHVLWRRKFSEMEKL